MASGTKGNCYICGKELGKTAMKNHVIKEHRQGDDEQKCYLLKIEGAYDKNYWILAEFPQGATLAVVDKFLREIWMECCGHMSQFSRSGYEEVGKSSKLQSFSLGDKLLYEYDFGTTTEAVITIMGETTRKKQKKSARILARNVPPAFKCSVCGDPAGHICVECIWDSENPFLCEKCGDIHEHDDMLLPVVNSPRMGECAYTGELDVYEFDAASIVEGK